MKNTIEINDPDLLTVTIIEKCRECGEHVENVIEYYPGDFTMCFNPKELENLCDACHEPYESDPTSWQDLPQFNQHWSRD